MLRLAARKLTVWDTKALSVILTQVATYKTLGGQTPFSNKIKCVSAELRGVHFQVAQSSAQTNSLCYKLATWVILITLRWVCRGRGLPYTAVLRFHQG